MSTEVTPRRRLIDAAVALLAERPMQEPTTRELCTRAGVTAPSLYHHFGDKDGLLASVLEEAFEEYLARKHAAVGSGGPLADFAAGWDMHVRFGLEHPLLYTAMFAATHPQAAGVTGRAAEELRRELEGMAAAGLLRLAVDDAVPLTLAASVGCVLQLLRDGGEADGALSHLVREGLLQQLTGAAAKQGDRASAAHDLLARLPGAETVLGAEETALLRAWLVRLGAEDAVT